MTDTAEPPVWRDITLRQTRDYARLMTDLSVANHDGGQRLDDASYIRETLRLYEQFMEAYDAGEYDGQDRPGYYPIEWFVHGVRLIKQAIETDETLVPRPTPDELVWSYEFLAANLHIAVYRLHEPH